MRTNRPSAPHQHLLSTFAVWLAALQAATWAHLVGWQSVGNVPTVLFLEDAERAGRAMLPDPEAYSHALTVPGARR